MIIKFKVFEEVGIIPDIVLDNITTIKVNHINFNGDIKNGYIVCNINVANDLTQIFGELLKIKFPIEEIKPISEYNDDDMESVRANNCSCFNYRFVIGSTKLSDHSSGNAIDINPMQNPWIHPSAHKIEGREYIPGRKGTITNEVVDIFKSYGWMWGGNWKNPDYQHFFKPDNDLKNKILNTLNEEVRLEDVLKSNSDYIESFRKREFNPSSDFMNSLNCFGVSFKLEYNHNSNHDLKKRIKERTSLKSVDEFNDLMKKGLEHLFEKEYTKDISSYALIFKEYNFTVIINVKLNIIRIATLLTGSDVTVGKKIYLECTL